MANFSRLHITSTPILVLGLFLLSANAMADIVERSNPNNEYTASGTDVSTVQLAANAANGDVIKVLNTESTATFSQTVKNTYTVRTFTIQSANANQQTINVSTGRCYDLNTASQTYNFTFENLFFQGSNTESYAHGKFAILSSSDCTLNLTLNNVTFKQFKSKKNSDTALGLGGVIHIAGNTNILSLQGSSADMIDNKSSRGGALSISATGLTSTVNNLTFKNNSAADDAGGAIYSNGPLSFTADNLTFESNSTAASTGGAIHADSGKLTVTADTLTVKSNSAKTFGGGIYSKGATSITADSILFESNKANDNNGGAIYMEDAALSISGGTIEFKSNVAKAYSGAIFSNKDVSISGNIITIEGNHVDGNDGGAIWSSANVTITGTGENPKAKFNANYSAYKAGALYAGGTLTLKTGTFEFTNNYDSKSDSRWSHGGAIYCTTIDTEDVTEIKFDSNSAKHSGGAMYTGGGTLKADKITFSNNSASNFGGGIYNGGTLTITGKTVSFTGNTTSVSDGGAIHGGTLNLKGVDANSVFTFSGNHTKYIGGAISTGALTINTGTFNFTGNYDTHSSSAYSYGGAINCTSLTTNAKKLNFDSNTSKYYGGALSLRSGSASIQADTLLFNNNKCDVYGGAIYGVENITFLGANTNGTFTNNTAPNGNDLYLGGATSVLTFQDAGTYSFDGGIYLENANAKTVINQALVTIAGRANDSTNAYQLQNVTISNGGKLTANLDYINSLTGTFNVGTADTAGTLELNVSGTEPVKLTLSNSTKILGPTNGTVKKTGDGTLQIYTAAAGLVDVDSFVVSSGRLDMKEYFTGALEIGELIDSSYTEATFSPGNSVGSLTIDGTFTLHSGSTLLIEQDATGIDTLSATTVVVESDSILDMPIDSLQPGMSTPIILSTNAFGGDMANDAFWNGLLTSEDAYYWNLKVVNGNTVMASVDANAVPEPSTWALLVLGVVVLFLRKRVRN